MSDHNETPQVQEERQGQSERLHQHGEQQGQVLGTSDREFVRGIEVDDLWDGFKGRAVLSQHVLAIFTLAELHVHETLAAPGREKQEEWVEKGGKSAKQTLNESEKEER